MQNKAIINETQFNPKIKIYIFLYGLIIMFISIIGIPLTPFWLLGIGQLVSKRYYNNLECRLLSNALYFKKGSLVSVEKTIPLEKIQDLTFTEGPLLRMLNLSIMQIETAGGGGNESDMTLIGIIDAHEFKEAVIEQRAQVQGHSNEQEGAKAENQEVVMLLKEIRDSLRRLEQK